MATIGSPQKKVRDSVGSIHCSRCGGLMIAEDAFDSILGTAHVESSVRRCVHCGDVIDAVILQNRRLQLGNELPGVQG